MSPVSEELRQMNEATHHLIALFRDRTERLTFQRFHEARQWIFVHGANPTIALRELNTIRYPIVEFFVVEGDADWLGRPHPGASTTLELLMMNWTEWIGSGGPATESEKAIHGVVDAFAEFKRTLRLICARVAEADRINLFADPCHLDVLYGFIDFPAEKMLAVVLDIIAMGASAERMRVRFDEIVAMGIFLRPSRGRTMTLFQEEIHHVQAMLGPLPISCTEPIPSVLTANP